MRRCEECGGQVDPVYVEPIRDGSRHSHVCFECMMNLAEEVADSIWALANRHNVQEGDESTHGRMLVAALISLNQRAAANVLAGKLGIEIAWRAR